MDQSLVEIDDNALLPGVLRPQLWEQLLAAGAPAGGRQRARAAARAAARGTGQALAGPGEVAHVAGGPAPAARGGVLPPPRRALLAQATDEGAQEVPPGPLLRACIKRERERRSRSGIDNRADADKRMPTKIKDAS